MHGEYIRQLDYLANMMNNNGTVKNLIHIKLVENNSAIDFAFTQNDALLPNSILTTQKIRNHLIAIRMDSDYKIGKTKNRLVGGRHLPGIPLSRGEVRAE